MLRTFHADDAAHVRPVIGLRTPVIALLFEGLIRGVTGEVVVITRVVIAGGATAIGDAVDHGKVMRLFGEQGQMLAQADVVAAGADGFEIASVFKRRVRFHVPHVDVRGPAAEEEQHGGFGRFGKSGQGHRRRGGGVRTWAKTQGGKA